MSLVYLVLAPYLLWVFYLAVMNLKRCRDNGTLTTVAKALAIPILLVGYVVEVLVQASIGTLLFLDPPREATLSGRLSRYWNDNIDDQNWRKRLAGWMKEHLLDPFDPDGKHIR